MHRKYLENDKLQRYIRYDTVYLSWLHVSFLLHINLPHGYNRKITEKN